ncbi:MAG: DMT family transporter [Isosphaeraceae bacterium]
MSTVVTGSKQISMRPLIIAERELPGKRAAARPQEPHHEALATSHRPDLRGYLYLALMVVLGSTTSPIAMVAVRELPVGIVPLLRFGFAGLCLLPFLSDRGAVWRLLRQDLPLLALVAALCVPINQNFFLNSVRFGPNSHVGLFYAVAPLVVWVLAWMLGHEALDLRRLWGVLASIAGVALIGLGNIWGGFAASAAEARSIMIADLLLVGAVLSWGAFLTLSKPLIVRHGALPVLVGTFFVGCVLELPIALLTVPEWPPMIAKASVMAWECMAVLSLFITPVYLALQNLSLRRLDASQVATFSNVSPVLTVLWGVWFFDEVLSPSLIAGGLLVLGGIFWTSKPGQMAARETGAGARND